MSAIESQRVRPGDDPASCPAGLMEVSVGSRSGFPVRLEAVGARDALRPLGDARWILELAVGSRGEVRISDPDHDVFPSGTVLTITLVLPGGLRLNVHPQPDVSSLPGLALLRWEPAPTGRGGDVLVSVAQLDVNQPSRPDPKPGERSDPRPLVPVFDVEPLGPVAVQARNLAREMVCGPRLPPDRLRNVVVVVDRSTSMRTQLARSPLRDAVAAVVGTAAVTAERAPSVYLAGGLDVDPIPAPDGSVEDWAARTLRADAFGFSSEGVCRALPAAHPRRDVVLVTDGVPADLDQLRSHLEEEPGSGRWRVVVVSGETSGLTDQTEGSDSPVRILGMPTSADATRMPPAEAVRAVVRSLVSGTGDPDGTTEGPR
jgi:hypothetical protein